MTRIMNKLVLATVLVAGLSACGSGNNRGGGGTTPPPSGTNPPPVATPPASPTLAERFGAGFAAIFNADANSEPRDPTDADIVAVNLTAEPIDF